MQAGDLADLQQRAVERWRAQSMQVTDAMPADEKQGSVDVEEEPFA